MTLLFLEGLKHLKLLHYIWKLNPDTLIKNFLKNIFLISQVFQVTISDLLQNVPPPCVELSCSGFFLPPNPCLKQKPDIPPSTSSEGLNLFCVLRAHQNCSDGTNLPIKNTQHCIFFSLEAMLLVKG